MILAGMHQHQRRKYDDIYDEAYQLICRDGRRSWKCVGHVLEGGGNARKDNFYSKAAPVGLDPEAAYRQSSGCRLFERENLTR